MKKTISLLLALALALNLAACVRVKVADSPRIQAEDEPTAAEIAAQEKRIQEELEAGRRASNVHVHRSGSVVERGLSCPKSVVKANRKKREAEARAKKAAAKKGKK